jgi:superfamily II DNA or RNA helicase
MSRFFLSRIRGLRCLHGADMVDSFGPLFEKVNPAQAGSARPSTARPAFRPYRMVGVLDQVARCMRLEWSHPDAGLPGGRCEIRCTGVDELTWTATDSRGGTIGNETCRHHRGAIRARLNRLRRMYPTIEDSIRFEDLRRQPDGVVRTKPIQPASTDPWAWLEALILEMAKVHRLPFTPLGRMILDRQQYLENQRGQDTDALLRSVPEAERPLAEAFFDREARRAERREAREQEREIRLAQARIERDRERERREQARKIREINRGNRMIQANRGTPISERAGRPRTPLPTIPLHIEGDALEAQDTFLTLSGLTDYFLREQAARWWVSNQSDDLLGLPYCRIEHLEYQIRTALRVIGPLRGRALLSDEVGLGKTIEAGLVLKEYLVRGMVKRFLVLTVPSLVDQWEEELGDKFNLDVATTNQSVFREDPAAFWRGQTAVVASLHTLKQPAHLDIARSVNWDLLVVDEAHYLRTRTSQAWQAVNAIPRQFLLLLTATPVQNSLDELYSLVTLLRPGQLPSPREFQARFVDRKRPHRPKEPEELRRLLGQVMVRNTRANAGVQLPPRRAETVLFEPSVEERSFWTGWETELRAVLAGMPAGQSQLWGRLLLQAAGSSPDAWRGALESFPDRAAAARWSESAPVGAGWARRVELLVPLTRGEGGLVIFSQFVRTQLALASSMETAGVPTFWINGQTPPAERQPIAESFRQRGGVLLLTHSGTEGRNLQFCHRLVNFDLPWNPMEIEQRIGRLHRLGQRHPVRIYSLVQAGTLQEHLLHVLQEKLNLFELVVGETGLILGDRFSSDEFASEIFQLWRDSEGRVGEALEALGNELASARQTYDEVRQLDDTLFSRDYESI